MRSAVSSLLLFTLLAANSSLTWSAEGSSKSKGPTIRVEAMVGEASDYLVKSKTSLSHTTAQTVSRGMAEELGSKKSPSSHQEELLLSK